MRKKSLLGLLLIALLVFPTMAHGKREYKKEYKLSITTGAQFPWTQHAVCFADEVRDRTSGRINIKVYPNAILVGGQQHKVFMMHQKGVIEFYFDSTMNWATQVKEVNLFNLPFLFPRGRYMYDAVDAIEYGEVGKRLFEILEDKGIVGLAWCEEGFRQVYNNRREIKSVDDMKNLKIREVGLPILMDVYRALGADPITINFAELVIGLQQGTIDGFAVSLNTVFRVIKGWQYAKYITMWDYVLDPGIITVNKQVWSTFTEADRKIIRTSALKWGELQKQHARRGAIDYVIGNKGPGSWDILKEFRDHGMIISDIDKNTWKEFKARTSDVYEKWKKKIGVELVSSAEKVVSQYY